MKVHTPHSCEYKCTATVANSQFFMDLLSPLTVVHIMSEKAQVYKFRDAETIGFGIVLAPFLIGIPLLLFVGRTFRVVFDSSAQALTVTRASGLLNIKSQTKVINYRDVHYFGVYLSNYTRNTNRSDRAATKTPYCTFYVVCCYGPARKDGEKRSLRYAVQLTPENGSFASPIKHCKRKRKRAWKLARRFSQQLADAGCEGPLRKLELMEQNGSVFDKLYGSDLGWNHERPVYIIHS